MRKAKESSTKVRMRKTEQTRAQKRVEKPDTGVQEKKRGEKRSSDSAPTSTKRLRLQDELNDNVCSICFGTYQDDVDQETGRDWVQCPCGRWTPEDCVEDSVTDVDGKERFCLVATSLASTCSESPTMLFIAY